MDGDKDFDLAGIGNACMDIVAQVDYDFIARHNVHKSHCIYIGFDELQQVKQEIDYRLIPGGSVANTVHCFHALGGKAAFLGKIAQDAEGMEFRAAMKDTGIHTCLAVSQNSAEGSTQVMCLTTPDGDRSFVTYQGVAETLSVGDLDYDVIGRSKIVVFDGYTLYSPFAKDAFMQAIETARVSGGLSIFNPGDLSITQLHKAAVTEIIEGVDIVISNLAEAREMFGFDTLEDVAKSLPDKKIAGAVTNGAKGAVVFKDGEVIFMPAPARTLSVIDTNGAGDHFAAGLIYGLTHDFTLRQMADLAELCAQDALSHPGARPLASLEHLLSKI